MGGVNFVAHWLGQMNIWISLMVAGLNGYLDFNGGGWVEWVFGWVDDGGQLLDDGGWEAGWVDDGGWVGCVGFLREMIV